jgi:chloramphenicol O-acetyltransferase type A
MDDERAVTRYLDLASWPRRAAFEFFRGYDNPYFNVTAPLDATALLAYCRRGRGVSFSSACLYAALRVANSYEPLRYRLEGGRVLVHDRVHAGTTALLEGDRLEFIYIDYSEDFGAFQRAARHARDAAVDAAAAATPDAIDAQDHRTNLIHFSVLPWISFTGLSHARNWGREDSVPKIAYGGYHREGDRVLLPLSIEVHHALMDGVHVARCFEQVQALFDAPGELLG